MRIPVIAAVLTATLVAACTPSAPVAPQPSAPGSPEASLFDQAAFDVFILSRPTPAEFKARFPDILLVEPGMMVTQEYRYDHSRYFPELDTEGRIVGGAFH